MRNVPKYSTFRKLQARLGSFCGTVPQAYTSSLGNHFYVNNICESIQRVMFPLSDALSLPNDRCQDFANPQIRKSLHLYPEDTGRNPISEVWQADRWKEYKPSELTPMYGRGMRQFYIEEVSQLLDGRYVIPSNWVVRGGKECADCTIVKPTPVRTTSIFTNRAKTWTGRLDRDTATGEHMPRPISVVLY